jgi:hypothetical protein
VWINCQLRKKFEITVMNGRFLLLSWGFIKAVQRDRIDNGQTFIGVAKVVGIVVAAVAAFFLLVSAVQQCSIAVLYTASSVLADAADCCCCEKVSASATGNA